MINFKHSYFIENKLELTWNLFYSVRPPGIYKGDYIRELYNRYDDVADAPLPPELPSWHTGKHLFIYYSFL